MGGEIRRCEEAIRRAREGKKVALVSSGDPGVYGLASLVYELLEAQGLLDRVPVEVVPGITSALMAAARVGAPLNHDFAVVSLSDYLTPWEVIERRLRMAAQADFVIVLYNPRSRKRPEHLTRAQQVLLEYREALTPVGAVRHAGREEERVWLSTLEDLPSLPIDMFTTVIVGNSCTWVRGNRMVTPRGYPIEPR
jgi:precorrin-3B C17-methyltransferase